MAGAPAGAARGHRVDARLRQVITNLVGNAIRFTDTGGITVDVREETGSDAGCLEVTIADTGIGIPSDRLEHVFQLFTQVDEGLTRRAGGAGLGLAISRQLVRLMGGEISVVSEPGQGSSFRFTARLAVDPDQPGSCRAPSSGRRVLVVGGDGAGGLLLAQQLVRRGFDARHLAAASVAASELLEESEPGGATDALVVDVPVGASTEALDLVRVAVESRRLRPDQVVVVSALSLSSETATWVSRCGVTAIAKPVDPAELVAAVEGRARPLRATRSPHGDGGDSGAPAPDFAALAALATDDNDVNLEVLRLYLRNLGIDADAARDGTAALQACAARRYDVVFMDVHMPGLDGFESRRRLRASEPPGHRTRVVAVSGAATVEDRDRGFEAGMDYYLTKPVRPGDLARAMAASGGATGLPPAAHDGPASAARPLTLDTAGIDEMISDFGPGGAEFLRTVVDGFQVHVTSAIAAIRTASSRGDLEPTAQVAHQLRGAALQLAAPRLAELLLRLEQHGAEGGLASCDDLLREIESEAAAVIASLDQLLSGTPR